MSDMPETIFIGDVTEGSNNTVCQIEQRHPCYHTEYIRKDIHDRKMKYMDSVVDEVCGRMIDLAIKGAI